MNILMLEHVNLHTNNPERLAGWYEKILGLKKGYRPPFDVEGVWLYKNDIPMVHLVGVKSQPKTGEPQIEHFAFRAEGLESFISKLKAEKISYKTYRVPELLTLQVYISDPDGNRMHVDFVSEEADALGF